jgi:hypothetical protein
MLMPSKNPPIAHVAPSGGAGALRLPDADDNRPGLDDRLVEPETRAEVVRGRRILANPAAPPHADVHCDLDYVVRSRIPPGYVGATDLLTRASGGSDFATDTCVRKAGRDPRTDRRYLEELAFEVVHEQSLQDLTARAEDLSARGVRRIFAILVKRGEVREWSRARADWDVLAPSAWIEDRCLSTPLPVRALLDAAAADDAVALALADKKNPVIEEIRRSSYDRGRADGLRREVGSICDLLGLELTGSRKATLDRMEGDQLEILVSQLKRDRSWPC